MDDVTSVADHPPLVEPLNGCVAPSGAPLLDSATLSGHEVRRRWSVAVFPACMEATGVAALPHDPPPRNDEPTIDPERARREAERRARGRIRRYCTANQCFRLLTLTYREAQFDLGEVHRDIRNFTDRLFRAVGRMPYVWVVERHKSGAFHVHMALGRFVRQARLADIWGLGFVSVNDKRKLRTGVVGARKAGGYLSKYVSKAFDQGHVFGRKRYEVARGYEPERVTYAVVASVAELRSFVSGFSFDGVAPDYQWYSPTDEEADGPPIAFFQWD